MENRIIAILKDVLETENITAATTLDSCEKWNSLSHLSLAVELETEFDVEFEPEEIAKMKSVAGIVAILKAK